MSFDLSSFAGTVPWVGGGAVVVLAVTFVCAKIAHRHNVIDTAWGVLYVVSALVVFIRSGVTGSGDDVRRSLLLGMTVLWGLRLAEHVGRRSAGKGEDPRYEQLLDKAKGNRDLYALRSIYLLQGLLSLIIVSPVVVGSFESGPVRWGWVGLVVWLVGVFFETVGDAQMERFRADPANKGKVIDVGLWRYTRHPNYFGDACVWWGIFLVAAERWPGVVTIYAPILMTALLTAGSGVRILEKHMSGRDGWDEYKRRTSVFFPLPPRVTEKARDLAS